MADQRRTIIILAAVLLALVLVSVGIFTLLPRRESPTTPSPFEGVGTSETSSGTGGFDTTVLQRSQYKALDQASIQSGLLPVKAPSATGKANPFL